MSIGIIPTLDAGFYQAARQAGIGPLQWLSERVTERYIETGQDYRGRDVDPETDVQKHVDRLLRRFGDPAPHTVRHAQIVRAALDTYGIERELEARGIRRGIHDCTKFFGPGASDNSPLFPPTLASSFIVAKISAGLVDLMVFADVQSDRLTVDKVRLNEAADDRQMRNVAIGSPLPTTELSRVETNVPVRKYGRLFEYAREIQEVTPLMVVEGFIRQIALQRAVDETDEVLEILHAGDGETGSAVTDTTPATDGTLAYADLITLELAFANGYVGRTGLVTATAFQTILGMSEYKDPLARRGVGLDRDMPSVPTPSGAGTLYRWQSTGSTYMAEASGRIPLVDPSMSCYVVRSPLLEEMDDVISSGRRQIALSYRMAVVKGDPNCIKSLDILA